MISRSEISNLLGCHSAQIGSKLPTFETETSVTNYQSLDRLTLEDGKDITSRNVGTYLPTYVE